MPLVDVSTLILRRKVNCPMVYSCLERNIALALPKHHVARGAMKYYSGPMLVGMTDRQLRTVVGVLRTIS